VNYFIRILLYFSHSKIWAWVFGRS
jgi:hypothetical protein